MISLLRGRSRSSPATSDAAVRSAWQVCSLLLDYPEESQPLGVVEEVLPSLAPEHAEPLARFLDHRRSTPLAQLQQDYVDTFDTRRRCTLFLTYFLHGDTRKRGMALLRFKQTYMAAGLDLGDLELPDYLPVVLEFAATADPEAGRQLLLDHRAGLELLRLSLTDVGSAWAHVVDTVCATLPPIDGEGMELVRKLAAQGPPDEEVGMTPYGTPGFDAALTDPTFGQRSGPVDLGLPTLRPPTPPAPTTSGRGA